MKKRPTLKDVAFEAGVATTTVARVLNGNGYVAENTREKVEAAVKRTGYHVNVVAQSLKRNRSYTIGLLLQSTEPNPFFVAVTRGVEEYARPRGYTTLTYNIQRWPDAERKGIDVFLGWRADALIFATPVDAANVEYASARGVPVVQVERPRTTATHRIVVRNYESALAAVRHLTDLQHRRIAFIGPAPLPEKGEIGLAGYVERERMKAYRDAMKAVGASSEGLVHFGESYQVDTPTAQGHGYQTTKTLLKGAAPPTAIFTSSDILAAGALQAIYEEGLRVPDDISVVGCDDTLAQYLSPLLSTVRLPARRLGKAAAQLSIGQLDGEIGAEPRLLSLDAEFILRRSTGPAKG